MPPGVFGVLVELRLRLSLSPGHPAEVKAQWYREASEKVGPLAAQVALWLVEAGVPTNQVNQYFIGENEVDAPNNPGGTTKVQKAGGDMTAVNMDGTQTIRDITIYKQDLDQTGAAISAPVRQALIESREAIEKSEIADALKPVIIENFDKLTNELKKGDAKDAGVTKGLWTMVYSVVKGFPTAIGAIAALDKLATLLGY